MMPATGDPEAVERMHAAYAALPALLERAEPGEVEVLDARIDLARACAEAGALDDAAYQIDEVVKDALRVHGAAHPVTARAREVEARIHQAPPA